MLEDSDSALVAYLICIFIIYRLTSNMAEGDSYGCKTYFLISLEGILYLLQLVSESRSIFKRLLSGHWLDTFDCLKNFIGFDLCPAFAIILKFGFLFLCEVILNMQTIWESFVTPHPITCCLLWKTSELRNFPVSKNTYVGPGCKERKYIYGLTSFWKCSETLVWLQLERLLKMFEEYTCKI